MNWKHTRGKVKVKAPSNIAWIKYWGKKGLQLPMNPSVSMTLENCHTVTEAAFTLSNGQSVGKRQTQLDFRFHGEPNDKFIPKIQTFLERIKDIYPFVSHLERLDISSENSFPHSSGIASSASGFCALACAMEEIHARVAGVEKSPARASQAARLGSGSACRSLEGGLNIWGGLSDEIGSDARAVNLETFQKVHPIFKTARNAILIASSSEKTVGSTLGHSLMDGHPYAQARLAQAYENTRRALACIAEGNVWQLGKIIETEAMSLHALMMTSEPSFILMAPQTLKMIELIQKFRESEKVPVFFTLDAGPNPHVLYFDQDREAVENILLQTMLGHCEKGRIILDRAGEGAKVLESHFEETR